MNRPTYVTPDELTKRMTEATGFEDLLERIISASDEYTAAIDEWERMLEDQRRGSRIDAAVWHEKLEALNTAFARHVGLAN